MKNKKEYKVFVLMKFIPFTGKESDGQIGSIPVYHTEEEAMENSENGKYKVFTMTATK